MASIIRDNNGRRRIQFVKDGKRKTIRLGKCTAKNAANIRIHIEEMLTAKAAGQPIPTNTAQWLGKIDDILHARLAKAGIVDARRKTGSIAIGEFIDALMAERPNMKRFTANNVWQAKKRLVEFFANRPMQDIRGIFSRALSKAYGLSFAVLHKLDTSASVVVADDGCHISTPPWV